MHENASAPRLASAGGVDVLTHRRIPHTTAPGTAALASMLLTFATQMLLASDTHTWTGSAVSSSYWSTSGNWVGGTPDGSGMEVLQFFGSSRLLNTNDFLGLTTVPTYLEMNIGRGGYDIRGNAIGLRTLIADYPADTNATVRLDLYPNRFYSSGTSIYVNTNNSTLTLMGELVITNGLLRFYGAGDCVVSGVISGNQSVEKTSGNTGEVSFSGLLANTYTGTTTVRDGTLRLGRYVLLPGPSIAGAVAVPGDLVIGVGNNGPISDLVVLERSNQLGDGSDVTVNGTGQLDLYGYSDTIASLSFAGGSVVTRAGTLTLRGNVYAAPASTAASISGNLNLGTNTLRAFNISNYLNRLNLSATVSGGSTVTLRKSGWGELVLQGTNNYAGPTLVEDGYLIVRTAAGLGSTGQGTTLASQYPNAAWLCLESNVRITNETLNVANQLGVLQGTGSNAWLGDIFLLAPLNATFPNASDRLELAGAISGIGDLIISGPGKLRLSGTTPNSFTGLCEANSDLDLNKSSGVTAVPGPLRIVWDSVVKALADEQFGPASLLRSNSSGTLDLAGHTARLAALSGQTSVTLGSGTLTVSNHLDHAFDGAISGGRAGLAGGDVVKLGPATWSLNGSNTHYGFTYIQDGTLLVNGTILNSPIIVSPGATLGGNGTVRSVSFSGVGGKIAPGASTGRLTAHGAVEMGSGTLEVELNGLTPGTGYDQLITDMAPVMAKGSQLSVVVGFTPPPGSEFLILNNQSASPISGTFNGKPQNGKFAAGGWVFRINYASGNGNDVVLERVVAPAASNLVAGASSGQMLLQAQGFPNATYVLEAAPHLESPIPWTPIGTNVANGTGLVQFMDADMPLHNQRFYRIASP